VFDVATSVLIVLAALLGGRGTVWGQVLGAFIIEPLANVTSTNLGGADARAIRLLIFGGLLGAVVMFLPRGVLPTVTAYRRRTAARRSAPAEAGDDAVLPEDGSVLPEDGGRRDDTADVLEVRGLVKVFGGQRAVDDADLTVPAGRITGLLGPNGSGKTTVFNLVDGTVGANSGQIVLAGRHVERRGRASRAHAGLARTYQLPRLFGSLTVTENVVLPEPRFSFTRLWLRRVTAAERARALAILTELGLAAYADTSPAELSYGQRKLVELAQVLWLDPVLVMLDEPAVGISPALSRRIAVVIRSLHRRGVGVLLVEHDLAFLSSLCERVYVMANGKVIATGTVAEVSGDRAVVDAYLGDEVALAPASAGSTA
jgi:branched-chain amino acid transport system permease protein